MRKKKTNQEKEMILPKSKVTEEGKDKKISFSFEYFKNLDEKTIRKYASSLKETLERIQTLSGMTIFEAIISHKMLELEKSKKTEKIVKQIINDDFFKECDNNIYDLFKGHKTLRVFGVLNSYQSCFYILMFDPTHETR